MSHPLWYHTNMKTIDNIDPIPMTPQGAQGIWEWDGRIITSAGVDPKTGEPFQRRGAWRWLQAQRVEQQIVASASIAEIAAHYKPSKAESEKIGRVLNKVIIVVAIAAAISVIGILIF